MTSDATRPADEEIEDYDECAGCKELGRAGCTTEDSDVCTGCGEFATELWLDPRPRHPCEPQAQFCRDCVTEIFGPQATDANEETDR